jgi:hypothetical protein
MSRINVQKIDTEAFRTEIDTMLEAITHPAYVEAMVEVKETPVEERLATGSRLLNPQALRKKGVPLPESTRISSRYFDEDFPKGVDFGNAGKSVNLVNSLNLAQPELLTQLRENDPASFDLIISSANRDTFAQRAAGCCCAGGASVCGGCG